MKTPKRTQLEYKTVKLISCPACGVEIADDVLAEHTKSVLCSTKTLAKQAELSGLVRCEDAIFEQLSGTGALVVKLKTGVKPHDAQIRSISGFNAVEEQWADSVAVALMRRAGRPMEDRIRAVKTYAKWREEHPMERVSIGEEENQHVESWCNRREIGIQFKHGTVRYNGSHGAIR